MQAKDIKPRTWYARKGPMNRGTPVLVLGTDRYSQSGYREDRVLYASPDADMTNGHTRYGYRRDGRETGYLAVQLCGLAEHVMRTFGSTGENEDDARKIMADAAELLDHVVADVTGRGLVPVAELVPQYRERGLMVVIVQGRDLDDDFLKLASAKHEQRLEQERVREAAEKAAKRRRDTMVKLITEARDMGLNTDPSKGGAVPEGDTWTSSYNRVSMSVETYAAMVAEIARLRRVAGSTLRADEIGEGEPCG